jgi:hypothetical protein
MTRARCFGVVGPKSLRINRLQCGGPDARSRLGGLDLFGEGAFQPQRAARGHRGRASGRVPRPAGFRDRARDGLEKGGRALGADWPISHGAELFFVAAVVVGASLLWLVVHGTNRRDDRPRGEPPPDPPRLPSIHPPQRECDRRSRRTTLVAAISLTAAPAAQDNAAWLAGEVDAGEAAATLDPPKTLPY